MLTIQETRRIFIITKYLNFTYVFTIYFKNSSYESFYLRFIISLQ